MEYRQRLVGLTTALVLPLALAGCNSSSDGDSGGDAGSGGETDGVVDVQSAVTLSSRAHWLNGAPWPFEHALFAVGYGHMAEEPLKWFFGRELIAQGHDVVPEGEPEPPECDAGAVDFDDQGVRLTAAYDNCVVQGPDDGPDSPLLDDQIWDGGQVFERILDDPDWERVYEIEHDAMEFSRVDQPPYWFLDGVWTLHYRGINDVMLHGAAKVGQGTHEPEPGGPERVFHDYLSVNVEWRPDGFEGTAVEGRMELTITATPSSAMDLPEQYGGLYGNWIVETVKPIRYDETITEDLNPSAGEVHITAEDGNTIEVEFQPAGMYMDGIFISWDTFEEIEHHGEARRAFLEDNFPGSW